MTRSSATVSPLARRIRLGAAIRALRGKTTTAEIGRRAGLDRTVVSKVEAGDRRTGLDTVLKILDALPIKDGGPEYRTLQHIARDSLERGWWDAPEFDDMGERQARTADLECGATIREYQTAMLPGLLQTEAYARHRGQVAVNQGVELDLEATVRGRLRRQQQITGTYDVVLEPQAIWRSPVPPDVMHEQLQHLLAVATTSATIAICLLPVDARLGDGMVARNPFAAYSYGPDDLTLVAVDTVDTDLVITDPVQAAAYAAMFDDLRNNALSPAESAELIQRAADCLAVNA